MTADLQLVACNDLLVWDRFVAHSRQGSVFTTSSFIAALGETFELWFVQEGGIAQMAVPILLRDGSPIPAPYPFTMYQGPMYGHATEELPTHRRVSHKLKLATFLLSKLAERFTTLSFCLHPDFDDLRSFLWFNYNAPQSGRFSVNLSYTGRIALDEYSSTENHLERIRTVRRQEFRRAESLGFIVEKSADAKVLDRLHELTFNRQGISRQPNEVRLVRAISEAAITEEFGDCFVARTTNGKAASALMLLHDGYTGYYLFGANDPAFRKTGASTWLLMKAIDSARERGCRYIDAVGINSPNRGDYKTSFGAIPVPYFTASLVRSEGIVLPT